MKLSVEKNQEKIEEYEKFGSDKNQKLLKVCFSPNPLKFQDFKGYNSRNRKYPAWDWKKR